MKRLRPDARRMIADQMVARWVKDLTCKIGAWNRDKVLEDVEHMLRERRFGKGVAR